MYLKTLFAVALLGIATAVAQSGGAAHLASSMISSTVSAAEKVSTPAPNPVSRPKSFDLGAMDKTVDPCEDFYQYSCGAWRRDNPIPPDQARWGRFNELAEYNRQLLHEILEKDSANDPRRGPGAQKIGDFYQSCMDETAANAKASAPLKPVLDRIAAISNKDELFDTIAYLQSQGIGVLF